MSIETAASQILPLIGGADNVVSAAHCATRLRLVLKDSSKVDKAALDALEEVKGTFQSGGQFQIVIGQGAVNRVHADLIGLGVRPVSTEEAKEDAGANLNPLQRFARLLSNIFVPIIPVIVACGLLMGVLGLTRTMGWLPADSALLEMLDMISNTAFVFLPILVAFSAAQQFGVSPFLAAALGGIMIHPALQNAWTVGGGVSEYWDLFGMQVAQLGYQGTVLPILIAVWVMSYVNRAVRRVVPDMLDIVLTPFLTLLISAFFALMVLGPLGRGLGDGISFGLQWLYNVGGPLAGLVFGGLYSAIVITGVHHSFHAIEAGLLANPAIAVNFLLPIWAMANVAQGGAALGVFLRSDDQKVRQIALPASLSCLLGITEAALFGINLRFIRAFFAAAVGGAVGGAYVVATKVGMTAVGVTGVPGIAIVQPASMLNYIIGMAIAFGVACVGSYLFALTGPKAKQA
ncbi:MAG: sucrose-specific PTS transporter subunit IIBC [Paracoccus sp. (in: a-proteobacteria)]|uniref:sucrose-specific PTS transporter subunit IIBC n=1 Tax=Paracoccus sp. TaxID=267 RepID=UPI0026E01DE6|nr:sucrose-specific PTS transporter subunit IIBC [Paracoccus sp. (in: a-proteobacteria)]MDO5620283.1 sucrose-specific PTS transporter subunit IIBC [Paracoccus sp. (in: a-proteobacteria)]